MFYIIVHLLTLMGFYVSANHTNMTYCHAREAACIVESYGFSPSCVVNALANCEEYPLYTSIENKLAEVTESLSQLIKDKVTDNRAKNCAELKNQGDTSGRKTIYPYKCCPLWPVTVYCDQDTDGGGWTVIQRRIYHPTHRQNFNRSWSEYVLGFGNIDGEFWLGLDHIHALTQVSISELKVDLVDFEGNSAYDKYQTFIVDNESNNYTLHVNHHQGTAGDSFSSHNNLMFTTFDRDNDENPKENCARKHDGAWWYHWCHNSNLNGLPLKGTFNTNSNGIVYQTWKGWDYSLKDVTMKIRPAFL